MIAAKGMRLNGRGAAAADVANDGRMDIAINTIGGELVLLHPSGPSGHWLDVQLSRFAPGAVVTAVLPGGKRLTQTVQAGSSYLSSADQRVHFGLGAATSIRSLTVRYPWGGRSLRRNVRANHVVQLAAPAPVTVAATRAAAPALANCTPARLAGRSIARVWNDEALDVLRLGGASEPVQARDLFDLATATSQAWHAAGGQQARATAISYAAYRLLVWRASYGANVDRAFARLTARLRGLCLSPDFTDTSGGSAAELGNRIGAAAIEPAGTTAPTRHSTTPTRAHAVKRAARCRRRPARRCTTRRSGSRSRCRRSAQGGGSVPADIQTFEDSQWGRVHTFAARVDAAAPDLGDPSSAALQARPLSLRSAQPRRRGPRPLSTHRRSAGTGSPRRCRRGVAPPHDSPATSGSISR